MMKKVILVMLLAVMVFSLSTAAFAKENKMTLEEFKKMWKTKGKTPDGAVKCLIVAALETVKNKNPDGKKMWGMVLPKKYVKPDGEPTNSQRLAFSQFGRKVKGTDFYGAIAASYLGGTPENGYKYSYENEIVVDKNQTKIGDKSAKIFVKSGGKDMSSPVKLRKNKYGYWKIFEYSSLYTGVKPVPSDDF